MCSLLSSFFFFLKKYFRIALIFPSCTRLENSNLLNAIEYLLFVSFIIKGMLFKNNSYILFSKACLDLKIKKWEKYIQ